MSAFAIYIDNDNVAIATDTMLFKHQDINSVRRVIPTGFTQKVHIYTQYRCCMVCMGYHQTSIYLDQFINQLPAAPDIEYVIDQIEKKFYDFIDLSTYDQPVRSVNGEVSGDSTAIGAIQILAYSRLEKRMVWYYVNIGWAYGLRITKKESGYGTILAVPFIKDEKAANEIYSRPDLTLMDALTETMKLQYKESIHPEISVAAFGGEVLITTMLSQPEFSINMKFAHKFENYDDVFAGFQSESRFHANELKPGSQAIDQKTLDNIFEPRMQLNIMQDVMNGRNLHQHQVTVARGIEAADFIIEQEGYLQSGIEDILSIKQHLKGMAAHIEIGLKDPTYRPDFIENPNDSNE